MKNVKGMKRELSEVSNRVIGNFNVALLKDGLQSFAF